MKHLFILVMFIFLGIIKSYSQSDFRKGYIIKNNNDTLYGLLDYRGIKANSKKCIYKKDKDSEKQEFTPADLKAYRFIDSKYYISKPVKSGDKADTLFLEYLINGFISIYYYRDDMGEHYLLDKNDTMLYELTNEEKNVYVDHTRYTKKSNEYIGILKYSFKESPSIIQKAEKVNLDHKSLIKITLDYNKTVCSDKECIIYEKKLPKIKARFGPIIGYTTRSISKKSGFSNELFYLQNSSFEKGSYPSIGLYFKINMPYLNEKLFIQYEGTYYQLKLKTTNVYVEPSTVHMNYINTISLAQNTFNNSVSLRYESAKGKIRPTLQTGLFYNKAFKSDYRKELEVKYPTGETFYTNETTKNPFAKTDFGINMGLGVIGKVFNDKELFIDLKYQRGFGLLEYFSTNFLLLTIGFQIL